VLIAHIPNAVCVVKAKLWSNPFFGGVVRAAGYIRNDEPETLMRDCAACLAAGLPLIIFPEGTRTVPGERLHFRARRRARRAHHRRADPARGPALRAAGARQGREVVRACRRASSTSSSRCRPASRRPRWWRRSAPARAA